MRFFASTLSRWSFRIASARSSRWSRRWLSQRSAASVTSSSAACTAHPGSPSCEQSLKRHWAASSSTSAKVSSRESSRAQSYSSRNPGVSSSRAPPGRLDELATRGPVPAAAVGPERGCLQRLPPEEPVRERRLPHARGAEQRDRPTGAQIRLQRIEPLTGDVADRVHGNAERDRLGLCDPLLDVTGQIALRQHDNRLRAVFPRRGQVPLEPPHLEVAVQARDQEHTVDVGPRRPRDSRST